MATIFDQYLQPVRTIGQRMADLDQRDLQREQLTGVRNQNQLQALAMRKRVEDDATAREDQNILRNLAAQSGGDQNALIKAARATGRLGLSTYADSIEKALIERQKAEAEIGDKKASTLKTQLGTMKVLAGGVMATPTPEAAILAIDAFERLTGRQMPEERQKIANLRTPEDVKRWAASHALEADKLLPTIQNVNTGKVTETRAVDVITGVPTVTATTAMTTTPGEDLQATTSEANNKRTVNASYANAEATRQVASATRDAAKITARAAEAGKLRQEFADLPEVKKFKQAAPAYQAVVEAAKSNNPQADINLIYGLAKLYDPESVVREGEYGTIANSQAIPEWLKGQAQRLVGGGRLTEATKKQIIQQAKIRYDTFDGDVKAARKSYEGIATRRDLSPDDVFPTIGGGITAAQPTAPTDGQVLKFDAQGNPVKK